MVEILVGMAIALLGILVITQVSTNFEAQKRSTTGGDSANNTGAIALFQMQRDLRHAGYGFSRVNVLGCDLTVSGRVLTNIAPIVINPAEITGADAGTDSLLVTYGSGNGTPDGDGITAQPSTGVYAVQTYVSFKVGDKVIATPKTKASPCTGGSGLIVDQVTAVTAASTSISVQTGVAGMTNGVVYNLGQTVRAVGYAVRGGALTQCDFVTTACATASNWIPIAND
ncbi:MAG: hypothetical protein ABI583_13865, partial [Betaproteobacteria bacterium]